MESADDAMDESQTEHEEILVEDVTLEDEDVDKDVRRLLDSAGIKTEEYQYEITKDNGDAYDDKPSESTGEEVVFVITNEVLSQQFEFGEELSEQELDVLQNHIALSQTSMDHEMAGIEMAPTSLSHLNKKDFTSRVEMLYCTEEEIFRLRDKLANDIRATVEDVLEGNLVARLDTKRRTAYYRYLDDCYILQRYYDGDKLQKIEQLIMQSPDNTTRAKIPKPLTSKKLKNSQNAIAREDVPEAQSSPPEVCIPSQRRSARKSAIESVANATKKLSSAKKSIVPTKQPLIVPKKEVNSDDANDITPVNKPSDKNPSRKVQKKGIKSIANESKKNPTETDELKGTIKDLRSELETLKEVIKMMKDSGGPAPSEFDNLLNTDQVDDEQPALNGDENVDKDIDDGGNDNDGGDDGGDDDGDVDFDDADEAGEGDEENPSGITYTFSEKTTQRGGRKLLASDGNIYIIKKTSAKSSLWRCSRRYKSHVCPATVMQKGNRFTEYNKNHTHDMFPDVNLYAEGVKKEDMLATLDKNGNYQKAIGGGTVRSFRHVCDVCELYFQARRHLEDHSLAAHGGRYICGICFKIYKDHQTHKDHMLCVHTDIRPFGCETCGKMFHLKKFLTLHKKIHTDRPRNHTCTQCGKSYTSTDILNKHIHTHSEAKHLCIYCGKLFRTKPRLREHINIHTRDRIYQCDNCPKNFTNPTHLLMHVRRHHTGEKPYPCAYCSKRFVSKIECSEHECQHNGLPPRKVRRALKEGKPIPNVRKFKEAMKQGLKKKSKRNIIHIVDMNTDSDKMIEREGLLEVFPTEISILEKHGKTQLVTHDWIGEDDGTLQIVDVNSESTAMRNVTFHNDYNDSPSIAKTYNVTYYDNSTIREHTTNMLNNVDVNSGNSKPTTAVKKKTAAVKRATNIDTTMRKRQRVIPAFNAIRVVDIAEFPPTVDHDDDGGILVVNTDTREYDSNGFEVHALSHSQL